MRPVRMIVAVAAVAVAVGPVGPANAADAAGPLRISGPSPYTACSTPTPGDVLYLNAEVEPDVASNPARPGNLVAVWQQDRWANERWGARPHGRVHPRRRPHLGHDDPAV